MSSSALVACAMRTNGNPEGSRAQRALRGQCPNVMHSDLARPANLGWPQACSPRLFRIGKKDEPYTLSVHGDTAARSAVNLCPRAPHTVVPGMFAVSPSTTKPSLRSSWSLHAAPPTYPPMRLSAAVTRWHGTYIGRGIVQGIADGPCRFRGSHSGAQRLIADQRAARYWLESVEDFFLQGISCKGQVDMLVNAFASPAT